MEFLKSLMSKYVTREMLRKLFIGDPITDGPGFSLNKLYASLRVAAMTFVAAGGMAAISVLQAGSYGLLAPLAVSALTAAQQYIRLHLQNYLPPQV